MSSSGPSTHRATYFKTTGAMQADTIRCISMITSIAGTYGIHWLCVTHVSDFKPQSTITNFLGKKVSDYIFGKEEDKTTTTKLELAGTSPEFRRIIVDGIIGYMISIGLKALVFSNQENYEGVLSSKQLALDQKRERFPPTKQ